MTQLYEFSNSGISGIVTTVGNKKVSIDDPDGGLNLSNEEIDKYKKTLNLNTRYIVSTNISTVDLCLSSAADLIKAKKINPSEIDGTILVTQSPDYAAPSSASKINNLLSIPINSFSFDVKLGCSGLVYGLFLSYSLINSGAKKILLCVGDIGSKLVRSDDKTLAPLMGDAGSAILIENIKTHSYFQLYSDGSGDRSLYIPNSGFKFNKDDKNLPPFMRMNGGEIFNFSIKNVPQSILKLLSDSNNKKDDLDYFILHQPNKYLLNNIQKRLEISDSKFPKQTQSDFGNQNSASISGTINGYLNRDFENKNIKSLLFGFGIGLSWGGCIIETENIYCPKTKIYKT